VVKHRDTRGTILEAALESLRTNGFAGTSTRAIASIGDFNPALIFYYFGSLNDLLVAALERSSLERLERYRRAIEEADSLASLLETLERIYEDDVASGHIRVVSELVAGSVSEPALGPRVLALMEPWIELAEGAVERITAGSSVAGTASPRQAALAAVTFYLGANLLSHLLADDTDVQALLRTAKELAPLADAVLGRES
jgi:AcrR family transcriptional regulator